MKKLLTSLMAVAFVAGLGLTAPSMAAKHMNEAVTKACKDKKADEKVNVDGKDVKCPKKAKK